MSFTFADLQRWVAEWEGPDLEFKSSVQKSAGETISAFANSYGGIIVFGVEPKKKELTGVSNPDEESQRLRQILEQCKPNPKPEQHFIKHENRTFIVLKINPIPYSQNPCFYGDLCFIRQGTTNIKLKADDLIDFLKKRALLNFEESRSNAVFADLDMRKVDKLLRKRNIGTEGLSEEDYKKLLVGLGVANFNGAFYLKNVAVLFFAKEPQKHFSNLEARIVKYTSTEPDLSAIKLDKRISGTLPELIETTFRVVLENIGKSYSISGPERKELPEYPAESLRELITNAFGHRDYFDSKDVLVEIFDDHLQITNPGGLLAGQTIANFDRTPQHRNPIAYRLLRDLGLGEGLGLGVRLIRKQFREARLPDPEFFDIGKAFQAVIFNIKSKKKRHPVEFVNERQKQLLAYLQKNKTVKTAEYAKLVGISQPTAVTDLKELIKQGKIRKIGRFRGAYYELL